VGTGFPKRSCSNKKIERDGFSKKNHDAIKCRRGERQAPVSGAKSAQIKAGVPLAWLPLTRLFSSGILGG
jgi:hypothetical protein